MPYKKSETSREIRLWLKEIIVPILRLIPEIKHAIVEEVGVMKEPTETKKNT